MSEPIKYIDLQEFQEFGYLQEVNRLFFHPLGLALEVGIDHRGGWHLNGIWDYRDDPEGVSFAPEELSIEKHDRVYAEELGRTNARFDALGFWTQPIEEEG